MMSSELRRARSVFLLIAIVPLGASAACGQDTSATSAGTPAPIVDSARLDTMLQRIRNGEFPNTHSVLVWKDGELLLEDYFDGYDASTPHQIRSATKAIGSMLAGIAIDRGFIPSENEPIYTFFKDDHEPAYGWSEPARQVRIRDFLSMTSGTDCEDVGTEFACEMAMYQTDDWIQYALDFPFIHPIGEHWAYNSSSLILVSQAIARGSGMHLETFADEYLFGPLGIESFVWRRSPQGYAWIGGDGRMTPRDMLKIGRVMLDRGMWNGERLLSEQWIDKSTSRQADYPYGVDYGYIWQIGQAFRGDQLVTAYWASGNGGQNIFIFPDHGMVVVFTGGNYNRPEAGQPFSLLRDYIMPAMLGEVSLPPVVERSREELERLTGVYALDFEPAATSTIDIFDGRLRILTPDDETIVLDSHTAALFTGRADWGFLSLQFEADEAGEIVRFVANGNFARFVFERAQEPAR
jgi:CubicO group peptidase (beta-lactamase class C family)